MKVYLMSTNAGRTILVSEDNKWYYFAYVINGCNIDCKDVHEAIECKDVHEAIDNLEKHVKTIYSNDDVIDNSYFFNHIIAYDGLDACSLLSDINTTEIREGVTQGDLSRMYLICDTDTIKKEMKINE